MNDYNNLDLNKVKEQVIEFASIDEAKSFIMSELPVFNPLKIKENLKRTSEALTILRSSNIVNFDGIRNPNEVLEKASKGLLLTGKELYSLITFHNHCSRLKKQFYNFDKELVIRDYTDSLYINDKVFDRVFEVIDNSGNVKPNASAKLKELTESLDRQEKDLYNRAHTFISKHMASLQEPSVYLRNNRIVFLIKNSDKNKYQGYTYGSSSSGLAFYVEPGSFIELNNRKLQLEQEIEEEINRLLREMMYLISSVAKQYMNNFDSLVELCVIFAKAQYGFKNDGCIASFDENKDLVLKDVCHPLIDAKTVVSNNYNLLECYEGIVISGSNTGGKTVSLKLIGLSVIMSYLGIPLIASHAHIPMFDNIYVDIDDNQSILDSLSTFSAHITNINNILKNCTDKSLILIDELISGTDPKEAQAISLAIIDEIESVGSKFVITTHFDDIKNYSYQDEKILLSSVGFNMDTLKPTYKYYEDSVGTSNAIEIASRYFDDQSIIDKARYYLESKKTKENELMDKLAQEISINEELKQSLILQENKYKDLNNELNESIKKFNDEKNALREKYLTELNEYIEDIKLKALEKLDSIKDKKETGIVKEIDKLKEDEFVKEIKEDNIEVGDNVRINNNEQIGTVVEINKEKVTIDVRGIKVVTKLSNLTKMPKIKKTQKYVEKKRVKRVSSEINLVGERVEEALQLMEVYLDNAYASQLSRVKVIHGIGTGALRNALRERMKKMSFIKSFSDGDFYDGGSAVTIVEFK